MYLLQILKQVAMGRKEYRPIVAKRCRRLNKVENINRQLMWIEKGCYPKIIDIH